MRPNSRARAHSRLSVSAQAQVDESSKTPVKYDKEQMARAREYMSAALSGMQPDTYGKKTFHSSVTHVSKSGMSRRIKVYAVVDGVLENLTWSVARLTESPMDDRGVRVDGCGMDMCFALLDHTMHVMGVKDWQKTFRNGDL